MCVYFIRLKRWLGQKYIDLLTSFFDFGGLMKIRVDSNEF